MILRPPHPYAQALVLLLRKPFQKRGQQEEVVAEYCDFHRPVGRGGRKLGKVRRRIRCEHAPNQTFEGIAHCVCDRPDSRGEPKHATQPDRYKITFDPKGRASRLARLAPVPRTKRRELELFAYSDGFGWP